MCVCERARERDLCMCGGSFSLHRVGLHPLPPSFC
uniref:Uncharacterized protein n=1 Tax=Arundo donax TaxID=35708 RepID=A0A0A9C315_ARUDO